MINVTTILSLTLVSLTRLLKAERSMVTITDSFRSGMSFLDSSGSHIDLVFVSRPSMFVIKTKLMMPVMVSVNLIHTSLYSCSLHLLQ